MVNLQLFILIVVLLNFLIKIRDFPLFLYLIFILSCYALPVLLHGLSDFYGWGLINIEIYYENALLFVLFFLMIFKISYEKFKFKNNYLINIFEFKFSLLIFYYIYIFLFFIYLIINYNSFFIFTFPFFLFSLIYCIKIKKIKNNFKLILVIFFVALIFYLYFSFKNGTRWQFFVCLISYFLIVSSRIRFKNIIFFIFFITLILPIFPIFMDLRVGREVYMLRADIPDLLWMFGDIFVDRLNYSRVLGLIMFSSYNIENGFVYFNNIIGLIPRWIWEGKPILGLDLNEIGRDLSILQPSDVTTSIGLSHIGESYAILGWWGLINAIPLGILFKIGQINLEMPSPISKVIGAIIVVIIVTSESLTYILPTLLLCLSPVFFCFILSTFFNYLYRRVFCDLFDK